MYYFEKIPDDIRHIVKVCFPNYTGRQINYSPSIPHRLDSYWSGGSKDYYCFYHLDEKEILPVQSNHPVFEGQNPRELKVLPKRIILLRHAIFCGKDIGITIYANDTDICKYLPAKEQLTREQLIVLVATQSLKSTYGGIKNYRFHSANRETGITLKDWDTTKAELIQTGHLNVRGAITAKGKNACSDINSLYQLKKIANA
jgi:hypothetical protein